MSDITHNDPLVTESKLTEFYNDIKPFLGCPAYVTQEGDAEYYSTDEKVVGRWTDGKPLYQKTIYAATATKYLNIQDMTGKELKQLDGVFDNGSAKEVLPYADNGGYVCLVHVLSNNLQVYLNTFSSVTNLYVTICYTKSADSASTTTEQKPTHYSTDEQVIGTWIDGKPLYQKTVYVEASYLDASTDGVKQTNKKVHNINNIKNIISCDAKLMFNLSGDKSGSCNLPFLAGVTIINDDPVPLNVLAWADKTNICIDTSVSNMSTWNDSVYFTLQYVKTTD